MVIITERTQSISEMAQFKGYGITIEVRSDDHGKFGNKGLPPHAHILDNGGKEIAQIELTSQPPTKASDVIWYKTSSPPDGLGLKIVRLAASESRAAKKAGAKLTVWQNILTQWFVFHEQ